jgi:hypothetical protein
LEDFGVCLPTQSFDAGRFCLGILLRLCLSCALPSQGIVDFSKEF